MRIIARSTLAVFMEKHPEARASILHWVEIAKVAQWRNVHDVVANFSKAKALNGERVRFEVAGGNYRLIIAFSFSLQIAFVKFVGSHAEYDRIDVLTVNLY